MVSCNNGFRNSQSVSNLIYCQQNLQWSDAGICERICLSLPAVSNGRISSGSNTVGSNRQLQCDLGYKIEGSSEIFCLSSGQWSTPGTCSQSMAEIFLNFFFSI